MDKNIKKNKNKFKGNTLAIFLVVMLLSTFVFAYTLKYYTGSQIVTNGTTYQLTSSDYGTTTSLVLDKHNNSWLEFDGVNDEIWINSINSTNFNITEHDSFSYSIWIRYINSSVTSKNIGLLGVTFNYIMDLGSNGKIRFGVRNVTSTSNNVALTSEIGFDTWYHVVGVFNDSSNQNNISIYLNNILNNSINKTITGLYSHRAGDTNVEVADQSSILNGDGTFYQGSIDEIRIYNKSLTPTEISEIYASGRQANSSLTSDGLVLWYSFDEASGTTVYDKSGNGNNGE